MGLNKRGFTYLELLIALAILCIVIAIIFSIFISYQKYVQQIDDQLELQYQTQIAMNEFLDKAMYTQGIHQVEFHNEAQHKIKKVIFENPSNEAKYNKLVFEHKRITSSLWYGYGHEANVQYANYIKDFMILPIDGSYKECRGIQIIITIRKNDICLTTENTIFFRNADPSKKE
jgi:prepilin-type N-terminal cleavage/methylation domain-containing protein